MRYFLAIYFLSSLLVASTAPLESTDLQLEIHQKREEYLKEDQKSRNLKSQIYKVAKQLEKIKDQEEDIQKNMLSAQQKISSHLSALKEKEKDLGKQKKEIAKKLRQYASWHKNAVGDMIFSSQTGNELDKRLYYLKRIVKQDLDKMEIYKQDMNDYISLRSSLKNRLHSLAGMKESLQKKQQQMESLKSEQQKLLAEASRVKANVLGVLKKLRRNEDLKSDLGTSVSFFEQKAKLELPIEGQIVQKFGVDLKENKRVSLFSSSLRIRAHRKQFVRAVFPGKVVYSDHLLSYGRTLILDHGDNFYTVYSNLRYLRAGLGEKVELGQAIADIGGSSTIEYNDLLFQIRHFSEAVDPEKWINKNQLNLAKNANESSAL